MISLRHKPYFLPQISAPYTEVVQRLDDEDVDWKMVDINPNELNPTQGITFSHEVSKCQPDNENPIWISKNNDIADGHHRFVRASLDNHPSMRAIQIDMETKDACRLLNKIQDIIEYEAKLKLEEIEAGDYINDFNDPDNSQDNSDISMFNNNFLKEIDNENEIGDGDEQTIVAYRKEPINEKSVVGNFFHLKPIKGYSKFEINFDNLLDTNKLGIQYKDSQNPVDILAKAWFPHLNFKKIADKRNQDEMNIKNKAIAEKARSLGYDGIKYGDNLLQGL